MKVSHEQLLKIIKQTGGIVRNICEATKISRQAFYQRLHKSEELQQALSDAREEIIDFCEQKLVELVKAGEKNAIFFLLKTLGKNRGYIEKQEIENTNKTINIIEVPELSAYEPTIEDIREKH
jgi:hypothetical protein